MPTVRYQQVAEVVFSTPAGGLVTSRSAEFLNETAQNTVSGISVVCHEFSVGVNWQVDKSGGKFVGLESRDGSVLVTVATTVAGGITNMGFVDVSDESRKVIVSGSSVLMYLDTALTTPAWTAIASASSAASLVPIGLLYGETAGEQALVVIDGRRPHIYRPNATAHNPYTICYDISGYMDDKITGAVTQTTTMALYTGSTTFAGNTFGTTVWCDHANTTIDGIPTLTLHAQLKRNTSTTALTGAIYGYLRDSTYTTLATSTGVDAGTITSTFDNYTFTFDESTTYYMQPGTTYWYGVGYDTGGTSVSYLEVALTDDVGLVTAVGTTWNTGSYASVAAVMDLQPGLAPTADSGREYLGRVWLDNPDGKSAYEHYSNVLNPNDWSAGVSGSNLLPDAGALAIGGAAGKITAVVPVQGSLYIVKGREVAELYRLSGSGPADFSLALVSRGIQGTVIKAGANAGNNGFVLDRRGLISLAVLNETQQINQASVSDNIKDALQFTANPRLAFANRNGQLWLVDDTNTDTYIYDVDAGTWSVFRFDWGKCIFAVDGPDYVYLAGDDGNLYYLDPNLYNDNGTAFTLQYRTAFTNLATPWERKMFTRLNMMLEARTGAAGTIYLYRDGSYTSDWYRQFKVPMVGYLTVGDLYGISVGDLTGFSVGGAINRVSIYDHNIASTGSYAGMDLSQFSFTTMGPAMAGSDFRMSYDAERIMAMLDFSNYSGRVRLKSLILRGHLLGRRMN